MANKLFDYLRSINDTKEDIMVELPGQKSDYNAYMTNKGLSYFNDTIQIANEMNYRYKLPARLQYDFLRILIRKRKRFAKEWFKAEKYDNLEAIKEYYGYSNQRAKEVLSLCTKEHLDHIKHKLRKGGKN